MGSDSGDNLEIDSLDDLKARIEQQRTKIEQYRKSYEARFKRNQYTNNTIIGASILLASLIAITGTSPVFKNSENPWANPLGMSAAAWLGIISTALLSVQKLYNVQEKIAFYPAYIVQAEELIEDLDAVNTKKGGKAEEDFQKIRETFRRMRAKEANKRPLENSLVKINT
jgi:biopolymer transport protein ExbB/TolQ